MNKKICQKCIGELFMSGWNNFDEDRWSHHRLDCPLHRPNMNQSKIGFSICVTEEPPDYCRYRMEHIILNADGGDHDVE